MRVNTAVAEADDRTVLRARGLLVRKASGRPRRVTRLRIVRPEQRRRLRISRPPAPHESASAAGLFHVTDTTPGIRRMPSGQGFRYLDPEGRRVHDADVLARIRKLAIPPAWTDVWICRSANGHIQAIGRDSKRRKQYRYHARWREVRDEAKYERILDFARVLPRVRSRTEEDLARPGLPREKVLATVVRLLETTLVRVGNEEYARQNGSFGLTTLRSSHVDVSGSTLEFRFRGKSGRDHVVGVQDRRLSRIVKRCRELPGQELFQYIDEQGQRRSIESTDVNEYLREITGEDFTAKDFRTWAGTVLAAWALNEYEHVRGKTQANRNVVRAIETVAARLGNTPAVCRKCYIHPAVIETYLDGSLLQTLRSRAEEQLVEPELRPEEAVVLALLMGRLARQPKTQPATRRA